MTLLKRFEQKYGLRNIKRLIRRGFKNKHGKLKKREDQRMIDFYRRFLYEDVPDDNAINWDEEILIKDKIFDKTLE